MAANGYAEAREFLARVLPWPVEGEPSSWMNVHWMFLPPDAKTPKDKHWGGSANHSIDAMVQSIDFQLTKRGGTTLDIYACMSSQANAKEKQNPGKKPYYVADRSQPNAVRIRSLYMDLDAKGLDKNSYASQEEMLDAFIGFLNATGMPRPSVMVHTGGGMHVYWVFSRNLTIEEWQPLAFALVEAANQHGLKFDQGVTIDSVRLLRIPDTFNRKLDTPRPVRFAGTRVEGDYTFERIAKVLEPYKGHTPKSPTSQSKTLNGVNPALFPQLTPVTDKLSQGIPEYDETPIILGSVLPECPFLREAVSTGGANYANPLWNLTTLLAAFTEGGAFDAHLMARGHKDYTRATTQDLYERKVRDRKDRGLGWPHCKTISANGATICKTCPHLAQDKTPFHYATVATVAQPPQAAINGSPHPLAAAISPLVGGIDLPDGYIRDTNGIIFVGAPPNDVGYVQMKMVCRYPMTEPWLQRNPYALHFSTIAEEPVKIRLPYEVIGGMEMRKLLQGQGLTLHDGETKPVTEFAVSWIEKLKTIKGAVVDTIPYGWNDKNGKLVGFSYGERLWTPTGDKPAPMPDPVIERQYTPAGEIGPWLQAAKLITNQKRPELNAVIAAAFAAPLVRFTGHDGFMLSIWSSESGIGKTTAMRLATAVWGDPIRSIQSLDDTYNSVLNKAGEIRNLPILYDELKTAEQTQKLAALLFTMTGGKEKSRMTQSVKQKDVGVWQTMLIAASNHSLVDHITSKTRSTPAGMVRILEYEVKTGVTAQISTGDAQLILAELNHNYGNVGLEYAKYLGANFATVNQELNDIRRDIETTSSLQNEERFWCAAIAVLVMGAKLSNRLGFTDIDEGTLKKFLIETLEVNRGIRKTTSNDFKETINVSSVLAEYLSTMQRHTLKTNRIWATAGKPPVGIIKVLNSIQFVDGIHVQIGRDDHLMRIAATSLTEFCKKNDIPRMSLAKALYDKFGMKDVNGHIGSGTHLATAAGRLHEIDYGQFPELDGIGEF